MAEGVQRGIVQAELAVDKLTKAAIAARHEVTLLQKQIDQMGAAQRHKEAINRSRRRINGLVGEPSSLYVRRARHIVNKRIQREATVETKQKGETAVIESEASQVQPPAPPPQDRFQFVFNSNMNVI
jgi:hypothetical protein